MFWLLFLTVGRSAGGVHEDAGHAHHAPFRRPRHDDGMQRGERSIDVHHDGLQLDNRSTSRHLGGLQVGECSIPRPQDGRQ